MAYAISVTPRAQRDLGGLGEVARGRVAADIDALATTPRPRGAKALKGRFAGTLRVRAGAYRVLYQVDDEARMVLVLRILDRKEAYR